MSMMLTKIKDNLRQAMKEKNELALSVLRMLVATIRNKEITIRQAGAAEITDELVLEAIKAEIKKRQDSIEAYIQGGRRELVKKEEQEVNILARYLPEQLTDDELEKIIKEVVAAQAFTPTAKDFGRLMGETMKKAKGMADGTRVSRQLKKVLGQ